MGRKKWETDKGGISMKRTSIFLLVCLLICIFAACGFSTTTVRFGYPKVNPPIRPVPDEILPEIEKNKELLLNTIQISDDSARRCAEYLYSYCVPELVEAKVIQDSPFSGLHDYIQAVGIDGATYHFNIDAGSIGTIHREDENGKKMICGPGGPD